tara:strand:+ start:1451 stop:1993 length:543 start_codon:yes stop_codon:yes gene_type:complete
MIIKASIEQFKDEWSFLSNMYDSEPIEFKGVTYRSSEHFYQCCKFLIGSEERQEILDVVEPKHAKSLARKLVMAGNNITRYWDEPAIKGHDPIKIIVMRKAIEIKFAKGSHLAELLVMTGNAYLKEGNWWGDNFWGDCQIKHGCKGHRSNIPCAKIKGENWLGKLLSARRNELVRGGAGL